jgi:ATP-dependent DNA helicase RecG
MQSKSDELSQSVSSLKGIGPKTRDLFNQLGIYSIFDLLTTIPNNLSDKKEVELLSQINDGDNAVLSGEIINTSRTKGYKPHYILTVRSDTGIFNVRFIHKIVVFLNLQVGMSIRIEGKAIKKSTKLEFIHPEVEIIQKNKPLANILPKYSTKGKISQQKMRKAIHEAFLRLSKNYEFTCLDILFNNDFNFMSFLKAVKKLHYPGGDYDDAIVEFQSAKERLVLEEIYLHKHELLKTLSNYSGKPSYLINTEQSEINLFIDSLSFSLTNGQQSAIDDINQSLQSEKPAKFLIQGDVGCGKTIVALVACFNIVKNGYQCLVLVPTEVLCNQHYDTFKTYLGSLVNVVSMSGKDSKNKKADIKKQLKSGVISVLICTHAILHDDYLFNNLALVIIDEQHKFGVKQREKITSNHERQPHIIHMSATPIPRTLALVLYENMKYIKISDRPNNRLETITKIFNSNQRQSVYDVVNNHLRHNTQVYWVCTRVEDNDDNQQSIKSFHEVIRAQFSNYKCDILHGNMSSEHKIEIINKFKNGMIDILIATSVIEVGVDCPNANCLVIENSEMFGLSQLHQLRGRVGRGHAQGYCYLLHTEHIKSDSIAKLNYLSKTDSGFEIAEYDLKNRGSGTYLGNRQSGMPDNYRVTNINDLMDNIHYIKKFTYDLASEKISILKNRWKIKKVNEIQL